MKAQSKTVGIGISTRDRWSDLKITLEQLQARGLNEIETIVIDDASQQPIPAEFSENFPWVRFIRSEQTKGYIAQRNELARLLSADTYLSLDDDSFIETGDVLAAATWLLARPEIIALGFPIILRGAPLPDLNTAVPHPIRYFIGCAHLVKRETFLALGGYRVELQSYCEEVDFTVRACKHGYSVYSFPDVVVRHLVSEAGRNHKKINQYLTRNDLWIAAWHYPAPFALLSFLNCLPRQFRYATHRQYWLSVLHGFSLAVQSLPRIYRRRAPLSKKQFFEWRSRRYAMSGRS